MAWASETVQAPDLESLGQDLKACLSRENQKRYVEMTNVTGEADDCPMCKAMAANEQARRLYGTTSQSLKNKLFKDTFDESIKNVTDRYYELMTKFYGGPFSSKNVLEFCEGCDPETRTAVLSRINEIAEKPEYRFQALSAEQAAKALNDQITQRINPAYNEHYLSSSKVRYAKPAINGAPDSSKDLLTNVKKSELAYSTYVYSIFHENAGLLWTKEGRRLLGDVREKVEIDSNFKLNFEQPNPHSGNIKASDIQKLKEQALAADKANLGLLVKMKKDMEGRKYVDAGEKAIETNKNLAQLIADHPIAFGRALKKNPEARLLVCELMKEAEKARTSVSVTQQRALTTFGFAGIGSTLVGSMLGGPPGLAIGAAFGLTSAALNGLGYFKYSQRAEVLGNAVVAGQGTASQVTDQKEAEQAAADSLKYAAADLAGVLATPERLAAFGQKMAKAVGVSLDDTATVLRASRDADPDRFARLTEMLERDAADPKKRGRVRAFYDRIKAAIAGCKGKSAK